MLLRLQPLPDELLTFLDCAAFGSSLRNGAHAHFSQQGGGGAGGGAAIRLAVSDFTWIKAIGKGSFGKVFMVRPVWAHGTGPVYAMKVFETGVLCKVRRGEYVIGFNIEGGCQKASQLVGPAPVQSAYTPSSFKLCFQVTLQLKLLFDALDTTPCTGLTSSGISSSSSSSSSSPLALPRPM